MTTIKNYSQKNSSFIPLLKDTEFVGEWQNIKKNQSININCLTDQNGTLKIEHSNDADTIVSLDTFSILPNVAFFQNVSLKGIYFRVKLKNDNLDNDQTKLELITIADNQKNYLTLDNNDLLKINVFDGIGGRLIQGNNRTIIQRGMTESTSRTATRLYNRADLTFVHGGANSRVYVVASGAGTNNVTVIYLNSDNEKGSITLQLNGTTEVSSGSAIANFIIDAYIESAFSLSTPNITVTIGYFDGVSTFTPAGTITGSVRAYSTHTYKVANRRKAYLTNMRLFRFGTDNTVFIGELFKIFANGTSSSIVCTKMTTGVSSLGFMDLLDGTIVELEATEAIAIKINTAGTSQQIHMDMYIIEVDA